MKTRETSRGRRAWQPLLPRSANTEQLLSHLDLDAALSASLQHHAAAEALQECPGHGQCTALRGDGGGGKENTVMLFRVSSFLSFFILIFGCMETAGNVLLFEKEFFGLLPFPL